jgi:peptide methionine sulfoxide reductase MsrA
MFYRKIGYAEVVQITYDKNVTNLDEILKFFSLHDPTTLNRQVMLEHNTVLLFFLKMRSKKSAQSVITAMKSKIYDAIVTTLEPLTKF